MSRDSYAIAYPRKRLARGLLRGLGRLLLPLLFDLRIQGRENYPEGGPLIVVGNHVAAMEGVLMALLTPWQVEILGAADIPHEIVTELSMRAFGRIPVHRGRVDRPAMRQALDVLAQGGVLGLFPEGGIWENRGARPQTGVAWLSQRTDTPVLPIGFGGTMGALGAALRLQRPTLTMTVGRLLPAADLAGAESRKAGLEAYARRVLDAVLNLIPADDPIHKPGIENEHFELDVEARGPQGKLRPVPGELAIEHETALAKLLHRPAILKIFRQNLRLPVEPLQDLIHAHDPCRIARAIEPVLAYLKEENPYLLSYRFGPKEAEAMKLGLRELLALARWAAGEELALVVTPTRCYYSPEQGREVVQVEQGAFEGWM